MATVSEFPAIGRILRIEDDAVVFQPQATTYELHLVMPSRYEGAVGQRVHGLIRMAAGKLYTVPSGGNFIVPIFGPPRTIQGRIRYLDDHTMVVQAGTFIIVELPKDPAAYDMARGPLAVGALVNVMGQPGATFAPVVQTAVV